MLFRSRRRLASSNNALARALADLLSADRIDEETWEDFEATLITSDLGVGPSTELGSGLRKRSARKFRILRMKNKTIMGMQRISDMV